MGRVHSTHGKKGNAYRAFVGKPEGKRSLVRPRRRWKDNIKVGCRGRDWIHLVQYRNHWQGLVNMVMNSGVPYNAGKYLSS
jgi:hypothetical protein